MNVTVIGATRGVGRHVVDALRRNGDAVTAYVRNPSNVPSGRGSAVTLVVGELSDVPLRYALRYAPRSAVVSAHQLRAVAPSGDVCVQPRVT